MSQNITFRNTAIFILAVVVMLAVMIGSIYYPFPNGQPMDVEGFIKLWLREVILLGGILIAFIFVGIRWLFQRSKPRQSGEQNAP